MALLRSTQTFRFKIKNELFTLTETMLTPDIYVMTIVSVKERWHWKKNVTQLESEIIQFSGCSSAELMKQCDEWFSITQNTTLQAIFGLSE